MHSLSNAPLAFRAGLLTGAAKFRHDVKLPPTGQNLHNLVRRNVYWQALVKGQDGCPIRDRFRRHSFDQDFLAEMETVQGLRMSGIETRK